MTKAQCIQANAKTQSLRREGRFAEAREQLRVCLNPRCPALVSSDCAQRLDELDRAQPTIVFDIKDGSGRDLRDVKVSVDGRPLVSHLDGTALAMNPGAHAFVFEVEGEPPVKQTFVLKEGEKERRERVLVGQPSPPPAPVAVTPVAPASAPRSAVEPKTTPVDTASSGGGQRTTGLVVGGAGIAALATGGIFALLANSAKSDYLRHCGGNIGAPEGFCDATGISGHDSASTKATFATAFVIGGAVAAAAGAVLFLTAPRGQGSIAVGFAPGGVLVQGGF